MDPSEQMRMLQKNLESVVQQLSDKTTECAAATKEATSQRDLATAMTKKLDTVAKRNKQLEKDNARFATARDEMVSAEVQTDPDERLISAQEQAAAAVAAEGEARDEATRTAAAAEQAHTDALAAAKAQGVSALEVAKAEAAGALQQAAEAGEASAAATAAAASATEAAAAREAAVKKEHADAAATFAAELAAVRAKLVAAESARAAAEADAASAASSLAAAAHEREKQVSSAKAAAEAEAAAAAAAYATAHTADGKELEGLRSQLKEIEVKLTNMPSSPYSPWRHVACPPHHTPLGDTWHALLTILPLVPRGRSSSPI